MSYSNYEHSKQEVGVLMKSVIYIALLGVAVLSGSLFGQSILTLDSLKHIVLEANPRIHAMASAWKASEEVVPQAGALPDPMISLNILNLPINSFAFDREPMTGKQIAFSQEIPFPGKLGLKEAIAREDVVVQKSVYQETINQQLFLARQAYFDLYYLDRAIEITRRNAETLQQFIKIAETKYTVGKGLQQDVLRAQVEHSRMLDKLVTLRQKRRAAQARLNAILNRPQGTPIQTLTDFPVQPVNISVDSLMAFADQNRPLFTVWEAQIRKQEKRYRLAKKGYLPDFRLGIAYTQRDALQNGNPGVDFFSGLVTVKVPLYFWRKQKREVNEHRIRQNVVQSQYLDVKNQVHSQIETVYSSLGKNYRLIELYRDGIIPQATQSLNAAIAGYQTDKVDFLTLLNNEITLFNYEMDYYRVLSDYLIDWAKLEYLTGTPLKY